MCSFAVNMSIVGYLQNEAVVDASCSTVCFTITWCLNTRGGAQHNTKVVELNAS